MTLRERLDAIDAYWREEDRGAVHATLRRWLQHEEDVLLYTPDLPSWAPLLSTPTPWELGQVARAQQQQALLNTYNQSLSMPQQQYASAVAQQQQAQAGLQGFQGLLGPYGSTLGLGELLGGAGYG